MTAQTTAAPGATGASKATTVEVAPGRHVPHWVILTLVCVGQFMVVLDVSIVNVALPSIQSDLHFSTSGLQWIVNAYTLTFGGFLLLGGRAADLFGRKRIFMLGLAMFTVASLAGGLAQTQAMLIAARALQGLGAAVLAPATLTILTTTFQEGPARARALGAWSAVASAGASAGSLLGGVLTDLLSWRWILFVNVPIGIVTLAAAIRFLPESKADLGHRNLDVTGAVSITGGLVALVYAIVRSQTYSWGSADVLVPLAISVILITGFLVHQARFAKVPLVALRIFRSRSVSGGNVVIFLLFAAMFSSWYFETLYMQRVLGYSPLKAGLGFLPQTLIIAVGAQVVARIVTRIGPRPLIVIGTLTSAIGLAWLSRITPSSSFVEGMLGPFLLIGIGMGIFTTPLTIAGTAGVPRQDAGLASGLLNTSRTVGAAVGLATLATVAASKTERVIGSAGAFSAHGILALTDGYKLALFVGAVLLLASSFAALVLLPAPRRLTAPGVAPGAAGRVPSADEAQKAAVEAQVAVAATGGAASVPGGDTTHVDATQSDATHRPARGRDLPDDLDDALEPA